LSVFGATSVARRLSIIVFLFLALLPAHARAEARIALLIGNETYASEIGRLANPHNDVALLEQALKGLGFEVVTVRDAGLGVLHQALNAYARRVQMAGPNAVGFFYYCGHGASDGSTNYLIPVDVKTTETGVLWDESLRLTEITRKLKTEAGNATHFVVFDACRNTLKLTQPGSRAVAQSKGFVPVAQENGMLIAYATAEGELASDVGSGAGPYAKVLAEEIVKPGIEAVVMFRAVQRRVRAVIRQEPYLGFNALGDVYLAGRGDSALVSVPETTPLAAPTIPIRLRVSALIDGRSIITIQKNRLWWHHLDWAAPGREGERNLPTIVNGKKWFPTWPTKWGKDVRCGGCTSSSLDLSSIGIHLGEFPVLDGITVVKARSSRASIKTFPSATNGYLTEVELDDNPIFSADLYEVLLNFSVREETKQ
jgi:hypothetical protein